MRRSVAVAMGSAAAVVGLAGPASASATIDLIWVSSGTDTISGVTTSSNVTLQVILTAGPGGSLGGGVSVDYSEVVGKLSVIGYASASAGSALSFHLGSIVDTGSRVENINIAAFPAAGAGLGLPASATAYLGTVMFHKDAFLNGTFEIRSDADGSVDDILDLSGNAISATTTFNSAFVMSAAPTATPTPTPTATPTPTPTATPAPDGDADGIPDEIDNCPFVSNSAQTNSDSLLAGDICQCGDVDNVGGVTSDDVARAQEHLLGIPLGGPFDAERCNVIGPSDGGVTDCDIADIFVLQRFLAGSPVTVADACDAYSPP